MATNNAINLKDQGVAYYNGSGAFSAPTLAQFGVIVGAASNNIASISVGVSGSLLIGSTGANPAFALLTSTNGSITFGPGAGSLTIDGTQATTTQLGSVVFATSAETIAGVVSTKATTPTGVGAKLGSQTSNAIPYGAGTASAVSWTSALTNGQVVIGSSVGIPAAATLTSGTGISISNAANSITINSTGGGISWTSVTGSSQTASSNNGYVSNNTGSTVAYTLPASPVLGDTVRIVGGAAASGTAPWTIALGSGTQKFHFGSASITTGTGVLSATNQFDAVELLCVVAGASGEWDVISSIGNITYT